MDDTAIRDCAHCSCAINCVGTGGNAARLCGMTKPLDREICPKEPSHEVCPKEPSHTDIRLLQDAKRIGNKWRRR